MWGNQVRLNRSMWHFISLSSLLFVVLYPRHSLLEFIVLLPPVIPIVLCLLYIMDSTLATLGVEIM